MHASAKAAKDGQSKTTSKDLKLQKQQQHKQKTQTAKERQQT